MLGPEVAKTPDEEWDVCACADYDCQPHPEPLFCDSEDEE